MTAQGYEGVTCIDLSTKAIPGHYNATIFRGFGLKILALYACSFKHVLLLDSDNLPLVNPDILINKPVLSDSGNLFFPDYWQREGHEPVKAMAYYAFDLTPPWETDPQGYMTTESGQILLDRSVLYSKYERKGWARLSGISMWPTLCKACQTGGPLPFQGVFPIPSF